MIVNEGRVNVRLLDCGQSKRSFIRGSDPLHSPVLIQKENL
jgi:hypothetical protein